MLFHHHHSPPPQFSKFPKFKSPFLSLPVPGEFKIAKGHVKASSRKYRFLWDEVSTSKNDSNEHDMPIEYSLKELSTTQILYTIQIVTTNERDAASMANPGNGAYNV